MFQPGTFPDVTTAGAPPELHLGTPAGRWVVTTTVLGSAVAMLTATVINVALPDLGRDLGADVADLQWIVNGYMVALASLILIGGSLGDRYGRRLVYMVGVAWFVVASLLCAVAPTAEWLIAFRILQGVGGALLTPGSLAIIQSSFCREDRSAAIGAWSGLTGVAVAVGPLVGGWLVDVAGWRWIFLLPVPIGLFVIWASMRHLPESRDPTAVGALDVTGAVLGTLALAGVTYPIIQVPDRGWTGYSIALGVIGVVAMAAFVRRERTTASPMVPVDIFRSRQFTAANLITFVVYAALGAVFFLVVVHLQVVAGYTALGAGAATIPITALMLVGSSASGRLAQRIGPRIPLTVGPLILGGSMVLMAGIGASDSYVTGVLPAMVVAGIGLTITVAPVTATVLAAADERHSGVASGINNAVARTAQLLAVAALPVIAGLSGDDFQDPDAFAPGFRIAMLVAAGLSVVGGLISTAAIRADVLEDDADEDVEHYYHCGADAPPPVTSGAPESDVTHS